MNKFKSFKSLVRWYTLPMSLFPFLIGLGASFYEWTFSGNGLSYLNDISLFINAIIALIGILCAHMFANLFDDYIDIKCKLDAGINLNEINFKSKRKARTILDGTFSMRNVEDILASLGFIALIVAIYFTYTFGNFTLLYIIPAAVLALFYPVSSRFGLSEFIIGVIFGPLLINGVYYVLTYEVNISLAVISVASGIMTSVLAIVQGIMDYEFDEPSGKKSVAVMLKSKKGTIILISFLISVCYITMALAFSSDVFIESFIYVFPIIFSIPLGIKLISSLNEYIAVKDVAFVPKWYLGPMENWKEIQENRFDYYMFRFYLARNLAIFFNAGIALSFILITVLSPVLVFIRLWNM